MKNGEEFRMTMDLGFLWSKILRVRKKGREKKCVSTCIYM